MATARVNRQPRRTLGEVLSEGREQTERELGRKLSYNKIANVLGEHYRLEVTGETVRAYHVDQTPEKKNALLIASLVDFYGLKVDELPAEEAERLGLVLQLLKRVTAGRTPPGTRTRNLQIRPLERRDRSAA